MKLKVLKKINICFIVILLILTCRTVCLADSLESKLHVTEYSNKYEEWLNLTDEEKSKTIEPNKYDAIPAQTNSQYLNSILNPTRIFQLLRGTVQPSYNLQTVIPENTTIKNQMGTNSCWTFASISALETNLALQDKLAERTAIVYDFSERHMNYSTARAAFTNNSINEYGFTKALNYGGNFFNAMAYLTNGSGAILESEMPFEDTEEDIPISEIQNKSIVTTVLDTKQFADVTSSNKTEIMHEMKEHITNYGGIFATIYFPERTSEYINNEYAAIYCNDENITANHAVTIIGWNDNFSKDNFNASNKPTTNGAWIIKNSYGTSETYVLSDVKNNLYNNSTSYFNNLGCYSANDITDQMLKDFLVNQNYVESKITISDDDDLLIIEVGDDGYFYISYEDVCAYSGLYGVKRASANKDYYNIYQNDVLGPSTSITLEDSGEIYWANVYTRDSSIDEAINKVSMYTFQGYTCEVYINPNGNDKSLDSLQRVPLTTGTSVLVEPGYHTLEFANEIKLTGTSFVVAIKILDNVQSKSIALEAKIDATMFSNVVVNLNESFIITEEELVANQEWTDFASLAENLRGNLCIKALTTDVITPSLSSIEVTTPPNKTTYTEGENFDRTGMIVTATYDDNSTLEISNYAINDGNNLAANKTSVTITYEEDNITRTTTQPINVSALADILINITITTPPNKTAYTAGENFDTTGMVITAKYADNSTREVSNYTVNDGTNLTEGKTSVTIIYAENNITKTAVQSITVGTTNNETTVVKIEVLKKPNKLKYIQNVDVLDLSGGKINVTYSDGSTAIVDMLLDIVATSGFNNTEIGKQTITVTFRGQSSTFEIEIIPGQNIEPVLSNFNSKNAKLKSANCYMYTTNGGNSYFEFVILIDNIQIGDARTEYIYYYYLSDTQGDKDIPLDSWKQITAQKNDDGTYSLQISINSNNLENCSEIADSENLYVYVKEVARVGELQIYQIKTLETIIDCEPVIYLDGAKIENFDTILYKNIKDSLEKISEEKNKKDTTITTTVIPATGIIPKILIVIITISLIAGISFYKYKKTIYK